MSDGNRKLAERIWLLTLEDLDNSTDRPGITPRESKASKLKRVGIVRDSRESTETMVRCIQEKAGSGHGGSSELVRLLAICDLFAGCLRTWDDLLDALEPAHGKLHDAWKAVKEATKL